MQKRIMLVEDEAIIALNFAQMIERHSYRVVTVKNGKEAIEKLSEDRNISLILMDINLGPGMDGTEAARRILEIRDLPIIFLTSYTDKTTVERVKNIARYGYVPKNLGEFVLIEAINMAYRLFEANQRLKERNVYIETIMENLPVGLSVHSFNRRGFSYINKKFIDIHGWPKNKLQDMNDFLHSVFPDESQREDIQQQIQDMMNDRSNDIVWEDVEITRQDGSKRSLYIQNIPLYEQELFISVIQDRTEKREMEADLRASERKYRQLYENAPMPYQSLNEEGLFIEVNPAWLKALGGYREDEVIGKSFADFLHPDWIDHFRENFPEFKKRGSVKGVQFRMRKKDGSYIDTLFQGCISYTPQGEMQRSHCIFRDITGQKQIEHARDEMAGELQRYKERLEGTMKAGNIAWWEMDMPSGEVEFNEQKTRILGYQKEDFHTYKDFTRLIHQDDFEDTMQAMKDCLTGSADTYIADYRIRTKDGNYRWFHDVGGVTARGLNGKPLKVTGVVVDITDLKTYEQQLLAKNSQLSALISEKNFLLREIFHRVKNNLAMVFSLVSLKEMYSDYDLTDVKSQIQAIQIIYDKLHRQEATSNIEFSKYISELLDTIFSFHSAPVHIDIQVEKTALSTRNAVALGLALNEIATNAIKHGFRPDEDARFTVDMKYDARQNQYTLNVSNSGNPFPEDRDFPNEETMGLRLVSELVAQLQGTIELRKKPVPLFTIQFPPESSGESD